MAYLFFMVLYQVRRRSKSVGAGMLNNSTAAMRISAPQQPLIAKPSAQRMLHVVDPNLGRVVRPTDNRSWQPARFPARDDLSPQQERDAASGKFSAESRSVVIELDSYGEYSPSGTGCHVLGLGKLPGPGIKKPFGNGAIEIKSDGFYFTFTARHLSKTPCELMDRQEQVTKLYNRISKTNGKTLNVAVPADEDEQFRKLMAGDASDYEGDKSRADMALFGILMRRFHNDVFKVRDEAFKSALYRDKWDRTDYLSRTILKVISEPIFDSGDEDVIEDDGTDEYIVNASTKDHEGWFPKGDVSLIGGSSGTGKTYWLMTLLEKVRNGADVWVHTCTARDYRVLMLDRGAKAMRRTLNKLNLSAEAKQRVIRVTGAQRLAGPVAVLKEATELNPGAEAWFIEGLDLWLREAGQMSEVSQVLDDIQRLATRRNVAVIASVGAPKQKTAEGRDTERYHGRDTLFGSVAWGRKSETIVLISKTDIDPLHDDCPRQYSVLVRNGRSEHFWMDFHNGELRMVDRPEPKVHVYKGPPSKADMLKHNVLTKFKPGERILYSPLLGVSEKTYYSWARRAAADNVLEQRIGQDGYFVPADRVG
jgi:hypothetical protein